MGSNLCLYCCILCLSVAGLVSTTTSSPSIVSDGLSVYQSAGVRVLLQAKTSCPVDFEHKNYTIITSQCKGPQYAANSCCKAFKEFACPYAAELNDLTNNCAETMFSYIRAYGNYPPGLFANECRDTKQGLDCTGFQPPPPSSFTRNINNGRRKNSCFILLVLISILLVLLS